MATRGQFRVTGRNVDRVGHVSVEGEIDLHTAPQLREALAERVSGGATRLVVDLSRVTFLDSAALGVLVRALRSLPPGEGRLDVVCPDPRLREIFAMTGLERVFGIEPDGDEANSAATPVSQLRQRSNKPRDQV